MLWPILMAALSGAIGHWFIHDSSDLFVFVTLIASASYIATPAAIRLAIPDAEAGIFLTMSLAVTFPFNIVAGIPLYWWYVNTVLA